MNSSPTSISSQHWPEDTTPVLSICCVTYNHAKYIGQCIDSFLMQETTFPVEILIHDDASKDATAEIIRAYQARYPHIIKPICQAENQYSKGIKPNITFNYPRAQGRYIAVCEGDDYWTDPHKLEAQVGFLENNPEYVICYHDAKIIDENGQLVSESKLPNKFKTDFSESDLQKGAWSLTLTRCFRNVIKKFPLEITRVKNVDTFLTAILGEHGRGKYMPHISPAVYRIQRGSIWSSLSPDIQAEENLNTYLHLYVYHMRLKRAELAFETLIERALPILMHFRPDINPYARTIEMFADKEREATNRLNLIRGSVDYRLGRLLLRPFRMIKELVKKTSKIR